MYARVPTLKMDPARRAEPEALVEVEIHPKVKALPGLVSAVTGIQDDGSGITVAVYENEGAAAAVAERIAAIWSSLAGHLTEPPSASGYSVMLHVNNG